MNEQWKQLKDTIVDIRDNNEFEHEDVTLMCRFLVNYMDVLEKQMQEPCKMTAEEYRQRMIQAFHNANTDELIALCVLPTEKEFEHLEWLLKTHYKKEPCKDAISRQSATILANDLKQDLPDDAHLADMVMAHNEGILEYQTQLSLLPPVTPQEPKTGYWIDIDGGVECDKCGKWYPHAPIAKNEIKFCSECGARMVDPQESEVQNDRDHSKTL